MAKKVSHKVLSFPSYENYPVYEGKDLELQYTPEQSTFILWSPPAKRVRLNLYATGEGGFPLAQFEMEPALQGTWRTSVAKDLKGYFYTFQIEIDGEWLDETPGIRAKAVGVNGRRAAIVDMHETNPPGWAQDVSPALSSYTDIIIYEMHHRDFSVAANSGIFHKGKYLALTETNTVGPGGVSSGIDHLKELGVTHIHLLPSFDFATIDEARPDLAQYNWGYDPQNYNVPEGSYATDARDPLVRIREFKEMVQALHTNGFRVIMDVVYNHTYSTADSNFNLTVPGYFYRFNKDGSYANASGCGNEIASEREMVRRFIVDSVRYWVEEYHVDGFRFDLMGVIDLETMNEIRDTLTRIDPSLFIYGEGWTALDSPYPAEQRALKVNAARMEGVAVFNDDLRDALKGSVFKEKQPGFASGLTEGNEESVKFGIVGGIRHPQIHYHKLLYSIAPSVVSPQQVIQYVSCHDDLCLVDKLKRSAHTELTLEELIKFDKLAQTIVFTSQGIPFLRAGEEVLQNKKGVANSYCSPDAVNEIDWSFKTIYEDIFTYYQALISLRKNHPAFRIPTSEEIRRSLRFLENMPGGVIAYTLGEHVNGDSWKEILVIFNGKRKAATLSIPFGKWNVVCGEGRIYAEGFPVLEGGTIRIEGSSAFILWR